VPDKAVATLGEDYKLQRWWIIVAPDSKESAPPKRRLPLGGSSAALAGKGEEKGITSGTEQGRKEAKQEVRGERLLRVRTIMTIMMSRCEEWDSRVRACVADQIDWMTR
jgi:hypothetical protein